MPATKHNAIELNGVSFAYSSRSEPVLKDITAAISQVGIVALIGANGSGKSTLLKLVAGLLAATNGSVSLLGRNISKITALELSRIVTYVPQKTDQPFPFSVAEMVAMGRYPYSTNLFAPDSDDDVVKAALQATGIEHLSNRLFSELSGGEQQLCLIARAIAQNTQIFCLDEPTSSLDLKHQKTVVRILRELKTAGKTVILSIHNINLALALCDKAILLKDHGVLAYGTPAQVAKKELIESCFDTEIVLADSPPAAWIGLA